MEQWLPVETGRLILRRYRASDQAAIHEYASDPEVVRYANWGPNDIPMTKSFLESCLRGQERWPRDAVDVAVEVKREGRMIGGLRLTVLDIGNQTGDFGYTLNPRHWNNGFATEAAGALLSIAFHQIKLHRVWATCDVRNRASFRVMETLG